MDRYGKWEVIRELDAGGQGTVFLVKDTDKIGTSDSQFLQLRKWVNVLASSQEQATHIQTASRFVQLLGSLIGPPKETHLGALKKLHLSSEQPGFTKAKDRLDSEIAALSAIRHPNVLKILDKDLEQGWFVGEYHAAGPLWLHRDRYKGNLLAALEAFRPLVDGLVQLHNSGLIHRDIKPQNVFVASHGRLVLGDLGIVFFVDQARTRITDTYESVGSSDWMPGWATGMKLEDIGPEFDVFCLGKLLWFMLSGRPFLRLWYHHREEFELERMFPHGHSIYWARQILDSCIVEHREQCTINASKLLENIDDVLERLRKNGQVLAEGVQRPCRVCGKGEYKMVADLDANDIQRFGLKVTGGPAFKIFTCTFCGHADLFYMRYGDPRPPAWK